MGPRRSGLEKRLEELEALVAAKRRGPEVVVRVINEDPEEALERMVAAGEITDWQRDSVLVIHRTIVEPKAVEQ